MPDRRGPGCALALVLALSAAPVARASEAGDRLGEVVAARIDMQRQLGEWLTRSLSGPAEPYRVDVVVRLELRGAVREVRAKQANVTPSVKVGGKNKLKLPGLGTVDGGGGQANLLPEITIDGGTRVTESVSRQLETEVARMTVLLFVDPAMPADRRELLARLAGELAGIESARGDKVVVEERPALPAAARGATAIVAATLEERRRLPVEVIAFCLTAVIAAGILAFGLSRRAAAERGLAAAPEDRGDRPEGPAHGTSGARPASAAAEERRKRRQGLAAFPGLADATPNELVQILAEADAHTAAAIADLLGLDGEAATLVESVLTPERRIEIGIGLATSRIVSREQLAHMEAMAGQILEKVRSRVPLGGPARLADFLANVPSRLRNEVLEGVAARDQSLAQAARKAMLLFEDLPQLADASVRQVVTALDPGTIALALVGA
ncbi:MAG TPA: FliG C-terminal domain-containing protein, partial [Anaeromyxobacter sp.]